jgi:uncharacterized protein YjcR
MPAPKGNNFAVGNPGGGAPEGNQNAAGNPGGGPPPGNDNAVGNAGGGASPGNDNALKHGGWSDPALTWERLEGRDQEAADHRIDGLVEQYALVHDVDEATVRADEDLLGDFREIVAMRSQRWGTVAATIEEMSVEREREVPVRGADGETVTITEQAANPAFTAGFTLSRRIFEVREKLGISPTAITEAYQERKHAERELGASRTRADNEPPGDVTDGEGVESRDAIGTSSDSAENPEESEGTDRRRRSVVRRFTSRSEPRTYNRRNSRSRDGR